MASSKISFKWIVIAVTALLFIPFLKELLLAFVFALGLRPFAAKFQRFIKIRKNYSDVIFILLFAGLIGLPVLLGVIRLVIRVGEVDMGNLGQSPMIAQLLDLQSQALEWVNSQMQNFGFGSISDSEGWMKKTGVAAGQKALAVSGALFSSVPGILFHFLAFNLALIFFLWQIDEVERLILSFENRWKAVKFWWTVLQDASRDTVITSLIVGLVQSALVTLGSAVTGTGDPIIIFGITFLVSFIPVIGAGPVALVLCALQAAQGNTSAAIGLFILFIIVGVSDNIIRSFIMSQRLPIHPIVAIFGVIGAVILLGFPGIFIGQVLISLAAVAYKET